MFKSKLYLILGIFLICASHLWIDFMLGVWPVYKTLVTLDLVIAGLIASLGMFLGEGFQLYFGVLSDKGFHQRLIVLGLGLMTAVPFIVYTRNSWILFGCVLAAYMGSGAFHPAAAGLLIRWCPGARNFLISLFACLGTTGAAFSQYGFVHFYRYMEGHTWLLALPVLMLMVGCFFFRFPQFNSHAERPNFHKMLKMIQPYRLELFLLYVIQICLQSVVISLVFILSDVLQAKGYEEWFYLGGGYFYYISGAALASLPMGYLVERFGYKRVLIGIVMISACALHLFLHLETTAVWPAMITLFCIGGSLGVNVPVVVAGSNSLVPSEASGLISALYMGGVSCIAGFGPLFTSLITADSPIIALQLLSTLLIVALCLLYFMPATVYKSQQKLLLD